MRTLIIPALTFMVVLGLNGCTIETSKKKDGFRIEITVNDDLVINGEKIADKKLDKEFKKLIKALEKEGLTKEEIQKSIMAGKVSASDAIEDLKKELETIKFENNHKNETN